MKAMEIEKVVTTTDQTLSADVLKLMNLGLFPQLCVALEFRCDGLDSQSTSSWEIFSPLLGERRFVATEDDDGNSEIEFVEQSQKERSDFIIESDDTPPVIHIRKDGHLIRWVDGPHPCAGGRDLLVTGKGFGSLYEYATGDNHANCSEAVAELVAASRSLMAYIG